ncbi:hypothetical protein [Microbacterium maritypicum]
MSTIHHPRRLRRFLPGKPDAETAFWLIVLGSALVFDIGVAALIARVAGA